MRHTFLLATLGIALAGDPDPVDIVRRSLDAFDGENSRIARNYTFLEHVETRRLKDSGAVDSRSSKTYDVTLVEGSPYRRLIEREDKPLPPEEERRQQDELRKSIESRREETPAQRAKRLADFEKERTKYRAAMREIPDAYNFRLAGEEVIDGRPAYVIEATPRPGYKPRSRYAKLYPHMKGTLWINKTDYHLAKTEAELIDNFNLGWVLVRVAKGARVRLEQTWVNEEVWLPMRIWFVASARVGLLKRVHVEQENTYSRYRKFQAESRIVSTGSGPLVP